jgi:hypothetical protein
MTIKMFKLITGEDVISDVKESLSPSDTIVLDNPAVISILQNSDSNNMSLGIAPFMPMINGDVTLYRSSIVAEGTAEPKIEQEYRSRFGSGIVVAPASALSKI